MYFVTIPGKKKGERVMEQSFSINPYLLDYVPKDYAGNMPSGEVKLDCSLGVNANLLGNCVFKRLHDFQQKTVLYTGNVPEVIDEGDFNDIKYYPHDDTLKTALAKWYHEHGVGINWLTADNFILGNGSYDILCNINLMCLTRDRAVLGHAPQFTAYIDHVNCSGSRYAAYYLSKESGYTFSVEEYLEQMSDDYEMFIVENPNNPTGQILPLEGIRKIAERAYSLGKVLVIDEAYAEYMPFANSAVNLVAEFPNLIVTRSLSKGWGMAGIRLGYAVMDADGELMKQLQKLVLPFNSNALARALVLTALQSKLENPADPFGVKDTERNKRIVLEAVETFNQKYDRHLEIATTYEQTPIMLVYYDYGDGDFDLQQHFMKNGLLTVSCGTYVGLGKESVRVMLPQEENMPLLLKLLEQSIAELPV